MPDQLTQRDISDNKMQIGRNTDKLEVHETRLNNHEKKHIKYDLVVDFHSSVKKAVSTAFIGIIIAALIWFIQNGYNG